MKSWPSIKFILVVCIGIAILASFTYWKTSELNPLAVMLVKGLHENAASLALGACPGKECDTYLGWGTKELTVDVTEQILQRWCVEVLYTDKQTKERGKAALEIILIERDADNPSNWKIVKTLLGANCKVMK